MKTLALDTEGCYGALKPWLEGYYLTCVGLVPSWDNEKVIWFNHDKVLPTANAIAVIQEYVDQADVVIAHNMKYDLTILRWLGVNFENVELHCTMITDYLLEGQTRKLRYNLTDVSLRYGLEEKLDKVRLLWESGLQTYEIDEGLIEEYVLDDTTRLHTIYKAQMVRMEKQKMHRLVKLQNEYTLVLTDMEMNGILWDMKRAKEIVDEYRIKLVAIDSELLSIFGEERLNLNSNQQLSACLFGGQAEVSWKEWVVTEYKTKPYSKYSEKTLKEKVTLEGCGFVVPKGGKTETEGVYSVDKSVISALRTRSPVQKQVKHNLLRRSRISQVIKQIWGAQSGKGLVSKVQSDGYIHPSLNQSVTATGRLSSSDPNGQNLPRGNTSPIKECITPRFDGIGQYDLSQIEWRVAAFCSQDTVMINEINSGVDQHDATCVDLMELELTKQNRNGAKIFNFRMIYGGTWYGFYMDEKMPNFSQKKWKDTVNNYNNKYHGLVSWHQVSEKFVIENGFLQLPTGRMFVFSKNMNREGYESFSERQIKNYPVQGMAGGDIMALFAVILRRAFVQRGYKSLMILTVHDSIVFDYINEEKEKIAKLCDQIIDRMPNYIESFFGFKFNVKLEGDWEEGDNYGNLKEVKYG